MRLALRRSWLIPLVAAVVAVATAVATHLEQERQYREIRHLYQSHAAFVGSLVRAGAQEATRATGLLYDLAAANLADLAAGLGPVPAGAGCPGQAALLPDLLLWATRGADGAVRGCLGSLPPDGRDAFLDAVLASPEPAFVDTPLTRRQGLLCTAFREGGEDTVLCRDRGPLDRMRREVGLGPLLASLEGREVAYVVVQDEAGILAASPGAAPGTAVPRDPFLRQVLQGPPGTESSRLLDAGDRPTFEQVGDLVLGDGSRVLLRTGLDASGLRSLRDAIDRRRAVMLAVLGTLVLLSLALAAVLDRADARHRRQAEALRRQQAEAAHWQSLGRMAATVAHEVRNPLNTIGMALQRLGTEFAVPPAERPEFDEMVGLATGASGRVERVVSEFLDLGRPLALDLRTLEVDALVRDVLAPLSLRAARDGRRLVAGPSCEGTVRVDALRFGQVLSNLVENALDAAGPGGEVRVEARREGGFLAVAVQDGGPGMDAGTLARVQEPFVTTKANGTGLGLPLARRLAEAHGGSLDLSSEPGRGTRATVRLPLEGPPAPGGREA